MKKMGKKAMKSMKKRAMKKTVYKSAARARRAVWKGKLMKSKGGLRKDQLVKSKSGKIVGKKRSAQGMKAYKHIKAWTAACKAARKALKIKGFVAIKKGTALYKKAKSLYK